MTTVLRALLAGWLLVLAQVAAIAAPAASTTLDLDPARGGAGIDAWPAVRVLVDAGQSVTIDRALALRSRFTAPEAQPNNFGVRHEALWLRVPVAARGGDRRWVVEIDYPPLNQIDLYHLQDGAVVAWHRLGNEMPFAERPMKTRAHAATLELRAGAVHEVLMRVQTTSSTVVPIAFYTVDGFQQHEAARMLLHGLFFGAMAALFVYAVVNAMSLREALFGHYAMMLVGTSLFFASYVGIGQQFLWSEHSGLLAQVAPGGILIAVAAGSLFIDGALGRYRWQRVSLGLRALAALAAAVLVVAVGGGLDYRETQAAATLLGPLPMLLALWPALVEARRGDRVAVWLLLGWAAFGAGAIGIALMLRGLVVADGFTQHLFQITNAVEMVAWLRVLSLRIETVRSDAERVRNEGRALHSLAHTDALTGLPNRRGLDVALAEALAGCTGGRRIAIYMLDLDGFKPVNDRHGHDVGDALLAQVGERLRRQLRAGDVIARVGGDEFVVIATGIAGEADAYRIGTKLLGVFGEPFEAAGSRCDVGGTIGYVVAPDDGADAAALLKLADAAMYAGKQSGRRCLHRNASPAPA